MNFRQILCCGSASWGLWLGSMGSLPPVQTVQKGNQSGHTEIYTWESVGEITEVSSKTLAIRRTLKISGETWRLEPGAASDASQLEKGDQILAKGKTGSDGSFETKSIYVVMPSASRQGGSGKTTEQASDLAAPQSRVPSTITDPAGTHPESRSRGGYEGPTSRIPTPTGPGGQRGPVGGLQTSRAPNLPRFFAGDAEGVIEQVDTQFLILTQSFFTDGNTVVRDLSGKTHKWKDLKPGQKIAVTVKDELDPKSGALKATVVRLLH
jgi:hypothetical protein